MKVKYVTHGLAMGNKVPSGNYSLESSFIGDEECIQANFELPDEYEGTPFSHWFGGPEGTYFEIEEGDWIFN